MVRCREVLVSLAQDFAGAIQLVDATAEHDRWKPGIGPFEEERQLEMILSELAEDEPRPAHIQSEIQYPDSRRQCDLIVDDESNGLPVEAKLLRFRLDNGNIDPNMYKSVFSPFPERSSSSLLTDVRKLSESGFEPPYGLLGLYYEAEDEAYQELTAERIAAKFERDVEFWYDIAIEAVAISRFEGLRHPYHQQGAVVAWLIHDGDGERGI